MNGNSQDNKIRLRFFAEMQPVPVYRPVETIFFRPAALEIFSIFSWIFGQFLQKSRAEILCCARQTRFIDVHDKVDKENYSILFISMQN